MQRRNKLYNFEKIYIEKEIKDHRNSDRILSLIPDPKNIEFIDDVYSLIKRIPNIYNPELKSKNLLLCRIKGEILQRCPGSQGHICCNYNVINLYVGCPLNCTYCILQSYLNQPFIVINIDIENIFDFLDKFFKKNRNNFYRIGTGELSDSLVFDPITNFSLDFIDFFSEQPNAIFEFKTKTDFIDNLLKYNSTSNIVIGFSVNPLNVISGEEGESASIEQRIKAMKNLVKNKYKIALHFDPIINIKNFDNEYSILINNIFNDISSKDIAWISLGTFRYTPNLKNMIEYNFPETKILTDEFIECKDGKFRYFKPIRINLYKRIIELLRGIDKNFLIYLCMESPEFWKETVGMLPYKEKKMDLLFKKAII